MELLSKTVIISSFYIFTSTKPKDENIINSFFNDYFKQVSLTDDDWTKIMESSESIDEYIVKSNFDKHLTQKELERLTANRQLPCEDFQNLTDDFSYKILSISKVNTDTYDVSIDFMGQTSIEVRMTDTDDGRKIDYIDVGKLIEKFPQ